MLSIDIAMATDTLPGVLYPAASRIFGAQEQEVVVRPENQVVPVVQAEQEEEAAAAAVALLSILLEVEALAEVEIW